LKIFELNPNFLAVSHPIPGHVGRFSRTHLPGKCNDHGTPAKTTAKVLSYGTVCSTQLGIQFGPPQAAAPRTTPQAPPPLVATSNSLARN